MDENPTRIARGCDPTSYEFNGKVMLTAVVILFVICVIIVCLHMYARWFLLRRGRNLRHQHRFRRAHHLSFNSDPTAIPSATPQGLDPSVLKSLPTFLYAATAHHPPLECAVCLSQFDNEETGRLLPKCNHCFHIDCIDMWFHSHSNCPLCRAPVQPVENPVQPTEKPLETLASVAEPVVSEAESISGLCPTCQREEYQTGCSSSSSSTLAGDPRKQPELVGITVEAPMTNVGPRGSEEVDLGLKPSGGSVRSLQRFLSF